MDSHVGNISAYYTDTINNKDICCSVTVCPTGFAWDPGSQTCQPTFASCFVRTISTNAVDQLQACRSRWRTPNSTNLQTGPYWQDALTPLTDDCFAQSSNGQNAQACCFAASYNDKEYGQYQENQLQFTNVIA